VKIPVLGLVGFEGDLLAYEHIWWDQCSVLLQVGALTPSGTLPMHGVEMAEAFAEIGRG
jgi:carboxymethylenebutenolidase